MNQTKKVMFSFSCTVADFLFYRSVKLPKLWMAEEKHNVKTQVYVPMTLVLWY